jgi:hypothetical protein
MRKSWLTRAGIAMALDKLASPLKSQYTGSNPVGSAK